MTGHDLKAWIQTWHPEEKAFEWDRVGLQIGSLNQKISKLMITLDVTIDVVNQAIQAGANFILSHHPLLFKPLTNINLDQSNGRLIKMLMDHQITVYSAHTNYDVSETGMNQVLAETLDLEGIQVLEDDPERPMGRMGSLKKPLDVEAFIDYVKKTLNLDFVKMIGTRSKPIQKVAISGGSGSHHYMAAKKKKADVYLTGDITYHTALDMINAKMFTLDIGHFTEHLFKDRLKEALENQFNIMIEISIEDNPYIIK